MDTPQTQPSDQNPSFPQSSGAPPSAGDLPPAPPTPPASVDPFVYSLKGDADIEAKSSAAKTGEAPKTAATPKEGNRKVKKPIEQPAQEKPARQGFLFQLEIVFGVALLVATLFTAWTPGTGQQALPPRPGATQAAGSQTNGQSLVSTALSPLVALIPPTATQPVSKLVGIVAGHWRNEGDPGAVCDEGLKHTKEVDVNLNIATMVQSLLTAQGYQVQIMAEFDPRLTDFKGAALLSIHSDSCQFINNDATGFKVASALANTNPERSARLTACLRARYGKDTGLRLHSTSVTADMTSYHAFDEIDPMTPAAIIETGFLNLDYKMLTETPEIPAQGISDGLLCFLKNESITPPSQPAATPTLEPGVKLPTFQPAP